MPRVTLRTPIRDADGTLYRPGASVDVPDALARRLGFQAEEGAPDEKRPARKAAARSGEKDAKDDAK